MGRIREIVTAVYRASDMPGLTNNEADFAERVARAVLEEACERLRRWDPEDAGPEAADQLREHFGL